LLVAALLLYLTFSDLSSWRDKVARVASNAMARELTIAGEFEVDLGIVTRVHATELSLANTRWGSEPVMASIDRLDGEINLWELLSGSIHLPSVDIEGGRAIFESDAEAGSNWRLGKGDDTEDDSGDAGPVRLRIDRIRGRHVELIFGASGGGDPVELIVDSVDSTGDAEGMHRLTGGGSIRGTDFTLAGRFGSFEELINLEPFDHDLQATLGSTEMKSAGTIGRIASLGDLDFKAEATIPDPTEIYRFLGLSYRFSQPLTIRADATTSAGITDFTLNAEGEAADFSAKGTIDSVLSPGNLDVQIGFSGPDIRPVAALAGISDLEMKPFNLEGHLTWRGFPIVVSDLEIRVGENWIAADGRLGESPLMLETDFRFEGAGPDVAEVASLAGLRMPHDVYEIDCHLLRVENGLQIEDVRAKIGPTRLTTTGFIGDPPEYANTDLIFEVQGPNLAHYRLSLGIDLPSVPFTIGGRLAEGDQSIALHDVKAKIGSGNIEVNGQMTTVPGMIGTDLAIVAHGRDLSLVGSLTGIHGFPAVPFRVEGETSVTARGYGLRKITARVDDIDLAVDGLVTNNRDLVGTKLAIEATGGDLSNIDTLVPTLNLPPETFRVKGELKILESGLGLEGVDFALGSATGSVDGIIGVPSNQNPIELQVTAQGPSLAVVESLIPSVRVPAVGFSTVGGVSFRNGHLDLNDMTVKLAENTLSFDGTVVPGDGLIGSEMRASIEGNNLDDLARLVETSIATDIPTLPERAFTVDGAVAIDETGYHLSSLDLSLGEATISITGVIGRWPDFYGSEIDVEADGPDASLIAAATGITVAVAPFHLTGRIARPESGLRFDGVSARLGEYRIKLDGDLGRLPKLIGTSLVVNAEGPDLELIREIFDLEKLPSRRFSVAGHFEGNPQRFKTNALEIRFGDSDVSGDLHVAFEDRPKFIGRLKSRHLRPGDLLPRGEGAAKPENEDHPSAETRATGFLISDTPFDLTVLDVVDIDLDWNIGKLEIFHDGDRNVALSMLLEDGRLDVDRFEGTGRLGATVRGSASLRPVAAGHRLEAEFHLENGMLNLAGDDADPSQYTPVDVHLDVDLTGRSVHEMTASANGRITVNVAGGVLEKGIIDLISADVLVTLLNALNPFAKDDTHTRLNCAVLVASFENGVMTLDPAAIQTDKVTVLGDGVIDFKTERLKLDWITKPRKGIGISASMFTNPYIRLGGTMSKPAIEMKPAEALATTGVAVATMGISLVAKGMLDRITAEKKVCKKAMKKLRKME